MMPQGSSFTTRPQLAGTFGMVASTHWLATGAGMAALEAGGTAFDAAAAAGLVLQVVEPHMNGIGGEVPVIGYAAPDGGTGPGGVFVLDGQGPAPGSATLEAFSNLGLDLVPGNGLLAACVPAAFGTWLLLVQRHGRLPLREVMKYAIGYARDGYPVAAGVSAGIAAAEPLFREHWPTSAEVYLGGGVPAAGSRFANPALAATYQRILDEAEAAGPGREQQIEAARRAFYEGFVAEAIGAYLARAEVMDLTGQRNRGLLSPADLAAWQARPEAPVTLDFMGLTVCKTGPWGSSSWPCWTRPGWRAWRRAARTSCTPWWSAPSSRSPTGKPGTAIPGSPTCRSVTCFPPATRRSGWPWWTVPPRPGCGRASPAGGCPGCLATSPHRCRSRRGRSRPSRPRRRPAQVPGRAGR
jgi:gamma-glutamyltranspeptidase